MVFLPLPGSANHQVAGCANAVSDSDPLLDRLATVKETRFQRLGRHGRREQQVLPLTAVACREECALLFCFGSKAFAGKPAADSESSTVAMNSV